MMLLLQPINAQIYRVIQNDCRVQLSGGNFAQNSGNNHHLTFRFEGGTHSFKRQGACVSRN